MCVRACVCVCIHIWVYVVLNISKKGFVENRHNQLFVMMCILIKYFGKPYEYYYL